MYMSTCTVAAMLCYKQIEINKAMIHFKSNFVISARLLEQTFSNLAPHSSPTGGSNVPDSWLAKEKLEPHGVQ